MSQYKRLWEVELRNGIWTVVRSQYRVPEVVCCTSREMADDLARQMNIVFVTHGAFE